MLNGTKDGKLYENGVLFNGTKDNKLYENGVLFNGTKDGKVYINGEISNTANEESPVEFKYDSNNHLTSASKDFGGETVTLSRGDILSYVDYYTDKYIKENDAYDISDFIVKDALLLKYAETQALKAGTKGSQAYKDAYNATIKSQMIKTPSTMTNTVGEIVEQNNELYVNNGKSLVKLNISAETYLKLFPPLERYDISQGNVGDCFFISGCIVDMMRNPKAFSQLIQMFSEDSQGNISIKFTGSLKDYSPITFEKGELKVVDGKVNGKYVTEYDDMLEGALGLRMIEQAFAISRFAKDSDKQISTIDIDEAIPKIDNGGFQIDVVNEILSEFNYTPLVYNEAVEETGEFYFSLLEDEVINFVEGSKDYLDQVNDFVKDLNYVNYEILMFLGRVDLKHSLFDDLYLTSSNPDLEKFRKIVYEQGSGTRGYKEICDLPDAQLKEILQIAIENDFYKKYKYLYAMSFVYIDERLKSYLKRKYFNKKYTNEEERNKDINEIKEKGLYNLLMEASYTFDMLDTLADDINNHRIIFSASISKGKDDCKNYGLVPHHAYSIEKIDAEKNIIYVNNPWHGGATIAVSYDIFAKYFYGCSITTL